MPATVTMRWSSALSQARDSEAAIRECCAKIAAAFPDGPPDALALFVTPHHHEAYEEIAQRLRQALRVGRLLGCSAGAVIGDGHELEGAPGLSVTAARLPGVSVHPFHLDEQNLPDRDGGPRPWEEAVGVKASERPQFVVLADPSTLPAEDLLGGLDFAYPESAKVGGLASGGRGAGRNVLFLDGEIHHAGVAGWALTGDVRLDTLVAQGCRPIGQPMVITQCHKHLLHALDGKKTLEVLAQLFESSSERDKHLIRTSLFLGIQMDPFRKDPPKPGDFLIRNPVGMDAQKGALMIAAFLRQGQVVQFHVRDARTAGEDLTEVLRDYGTRMLKEGQGDSLPPPPSGALLFSCLGRGRHMYGRADHDTDLFRTQLGDIPLGGFFCNGEIGPVSGTTYVHGFTSCFGIFRTMS